MLRPTLRSLLTSTLLIILAADAMSARADDLPPFEPLDVFALEWARGPQISPDGSHIVYVRGSYDIETDRSRAQLWMIEVATGEHRPLLGEEAGVSPRWSPDGTRIAYLRGGQIRVKHLDGEREDYAITRVRDGAGSFAWSPDGTQIAFVMEVPEEKRSWARVPSPPKGAKWAEAATVIDRLVYRRDGGGYVEGGHSHIFVVPATGGSARQLTDGPYNHNPPLAWNPDGSMIYFSANREEDWEYDTGESEIWSVVVDQRDAPPEARLQKVTDRPGPDGSPAIHADGSWLAILGHDPSPLGHRANELFILRPDGSDRRRLIPNFDRSIDRVVWNGNKDELLIQYDDFGQTKIAKVAIDKNQVEPIPAVFGMGGTTLGRPYTSGSFSVSNKGTIAYTAGSPTRPADVAYVSADGNTQLILTRLNEDLLAHRELGELEELTVPSSHDGLPIQAWVVYPPGFDPEKKYPLVLEIHGGPFAAYGPHFSAEVQLYAAAGNVVLYVNPRGSTSYGSKFANEIHHAYPSHDYDDLISCVDAVIAKGSIDTSHLFVTGGSGGGVLTAWIVGKTDRFRAAVVAKPVIHWTSFVLTADFSNFFVKQWFPGPPWEHPEHYWQRSPLSLVGNVSTPTMLLTGEEDYRTPMSETEQYYQALKLRKIETAMVRIPGAGHGIAARPSNLVRKVAYILGWFEKNSELP